MVSFIAPMLMLSLHMLKQTLRVCAVKAVVFGNPKSTTCVKTIVLSAPSRWRWTILVVLSFSCKSVFLPISMPLVPMPSSISTTSVGLVTVTEVTLVLVKRTKKNCPKYLCWDVGQMVSYTPNLWSLVTTSPIWAQVSTVHVLWSTSSSSIPRPNLAMLAEPKGLDISIMLAF